MKTNIIDIKFSYDEAQIYLYLILGLSVAIYVLIFRKKISYLLAPESVIDSSKKYIILTFANFLPSIVITGLLTALIREAIIDSEYYKYENYSLIFGLILLIILLIFSGIIRDVRK